MSFDLFSTASAEPAQPETDPPATGPGPGETAPAASGHADPERPATRRRERERALSPSEVNALARRLLEEGLPPLWVEGEIGGWKRHASGHCYFTLRDRRSQLRCVMFASDAARLPTEPEEGMRVRVLGGLTLYERRGEFQLTARRLEADGGDGLWRLAFERLRRRLDAEGLLDPARKRPLPRCPATVGIVTSPVGAVLHDILHVLERRAPWTRVVFVPARVQGDGAAADIAAALRHLSASGLADVVIVGRGGGSVEDLWAFNEEAVARAIAACPVPVVSAVGHETDFSIADLVADVRAPTPSAAAELVVLERAALLRELRVLDGRMRAGLRRHAERGARRLDRAGERLGVGIRRIARDRAARLAALSGRLHALSPLAALARGYAVPLDAEGHVLRRDAEFAEGRAFRLRVVDGVVPCRVERRDGEARP